MLYTFKILSKISYTYSSTLQINFTNKFTYIKSKSKKKELLKIQLCVNENSKSFDNYWATYIYQATMYILCIISELIKQSVIGHTLIISH